MNKEQIIDEAYENYSKEYEKDNSIGMCLLVKRVDGKSTYRKPNKEMFVDLCTYDKTFSEKWGLKIEERELSREERYDLIPSITGHSTENIDMRKKINNFQGNTPGVSYHEEWIDSFNIPTKLITLTYNNETLESYE